MTNRIPFTETEKRSLAAVLALLNGGRAWTQDVRARDRRGGSTHPHSPKAAAWCLLGALEVLALPYVWQHALVQKLAVRLGCPVFRFNDGAASFGEVQAFLRSCLEEK